MNEQTGIEKIKQHISECHQRIKQKHNLWREALDYANPAIAEEIARERQDEILFVNGMERALKYLEEQGVVGHE